MLPLILPNMKITGVNRRLHALLPLTLMQVCYVDPQT